MSRTAHVFARFFVPAAAAFFLTAASPVDEIPYGKWQKLSAVHAVVADVDKASFDKAVAVYPDKGGKTYNVRVGRYLYWRLVNMFQPSTRIGGLRLVNFRLSCEPETPFVFVRVRCSMTARLSLVQNGRPQPIVVIAQRLKVGAWFDPKKADYAPTIHAELKQPLRQILLAVQSRVPGTIPPPKD